MCARASLQQAAWTQAAAGAAARAKRRGGAMAGARASAGGGQERCLPRIARQAARSEAECARVRSALLLLGAHLAFLQPAAGPCMRSMQGVACGGMLVDASLPASLVWSWSAGMWSVAGRAASVPGPRTVKAPCGGSGPWFSQAAVVFPCSERCGGMYMARFHGRVAPGCVHFAVRRSSSSCA